MAHFAKLDDNNVVLQVLVVDNSQIDNMPFPESEPIGIAYLSVLYDGYTNWKQTSYNNNFRFRYAGIGYTYDPVLDSFIRPKPFPSWLLNTTTTNWEAPVPYPTDGKYYDWDEETLSWVLADPQPEASAASNKVAMSTGTSKKSSSQVA